MTNFVFNIAKGRVGEFFNRVDGNDPANSAIICVPLATSGTEAQGQDLDTLAAVEADANFSEQVGSTWARITLTDAQLAATNSEVDDVNNRWDVSIPQLDFGSPAAANDTTGLLICYDPDTTAGTDANIVPLLHLDMVVETDGNQVIVNAGDVLRAS